jgi:hypothetical protein
VIQAHNNYIWIFCHFPWNCEKKCFVCTNKRYVSPNFAMNWCIHIIWIANKICLNGSGGSRDFSTIKVGFQRGGGFHHYFWFSKGGSTLKMRHFYPILTKFSDERGGSDPRTPPSGSANEWCQLPNEMMRDLCTSGEKANFTVCTKLYNWESVCYGGWFVPVTVCCHLPREMTH